MVVVEAVEVVVEEAAAEVDQAVAAEAEAR